jgi:glyoxylase I family protein
VSTRGEPGPCAPVTGLSHVQLLVSDLEASAKWYSAALGLESYADDRDIGYVALRHGAAKFVVVLSAATTPRYGSPGSPGSPGEGLDHLALAVADGASLQAWAEHLTEIGIDHAGVVLEGGHPSRQLRDPDGIAIELVAP